MRLLVLAAEACAIVIFVMVRACLAHPPDMVAACHALTDTAKRLECYDAIPVPIAASNAKFSTPTGNLVWTGAGGLNTHLFQVSSPWTIHWSATGGYFGIYVHTADGGLVGLGANQPGAGAGTSYQPHGGSYYLAIYATDRWRVWLTPQ